MPHGSRKVEDCQPIQPLVYGKKTLICHDQESLQISDWTAFAEYFKMYADPPCVLTAVTQTGADLLRPILICHSELNSKDLQWLETHKSIGVYYWSHALIALDWFRYAQHDATLNAKQPKFDFLIYNRAWQGLREYRLKFTQLLIDNNLYHNSKSWFNAYDNGNHYIDHKFKNKDLAIDRFDLQQFFDPTLATSCYSANYDSGDYQQSRIEVVLETVFDDTKLHLTEKTLRPIACKQPFVLVSTPGSLDLLKHYGFRTFDDCWDETYDKILDPTQRMKSIMNVMTTISRMPVHKKQTMLDHAQTICEHNQQWFFSKDFFNLVCNEFKQNLSKAVQKYHDRVMINNGL